MSFLQHLNSIQESCERKSELTFVSKSFQIITFPAGHLDPEAKTYTEKDNTYHKLSPEILTTLTYRNNIINTFHTRGMMNLSMRDEIKKKYLEICERFKALFGQKQLEEITNSRSNKATEISDSDDDNFIGKHLLFPCDRTHKFNTTLTLDSARKVTAIEKVAYGLGWTDADLYQNQGRFPFPCGNEYGLTCFISKDTTIGEITPDSIELIHRKEFRRGSVLKYYKHPAERSHL